MRKALLLILCLVSLAGRAQRSNHEAEIGRNLELFADIYRQLDLYYVDSLSADTIIKWAIDAMLERVDPFTAYHPADDEELRQMASGKYAGIGSVIRYHKGERRAVISEPYEGTPSHQAGLRAGDVILSIDGEDIEGMKLEDVTTKLRGEAGTKVNVKVRRGGRILQFPITRQTIQLPVVPYSALLPQDSIGYIALTGFTQGAYIEMKQAMLDLKAQGMKRLVLDLRGNPGGALDEAVAIVSLFVPRGRQVVYTKGKIPAANREYYTTLEPIDTLMPIAVMVDATSASAAEIVSGALQDMDRAVVVGDRTYGKGLVQSIHELPYRGNLRITVSRYYIPSGRCIQAYDYRHLHADGTATHVPDSLTREFQTMHGRTVRDGGGIAPDITPPADSIPRLYYEITNSDPMFDFVTHYARRHDTIAAPANFSLTDEEYEEFALYIEESGLKGLTADTVVTLKSHILPTLNLDIVARYYLQRGTYEAELADDTDPVLAEAKAILRNDERYHNTLRP